MSEIVVRCYACNERFTVTRNQKEAKCPNCGKEWRVEVFDNQARLFPK